MSNQECKHETMGLTPEMVYCKECGEVMDPLQVLIKYGNDDGYYRKALFDRKRKVELLGEDIRRLEKDLREGSKRYRALADKTYQKQKELDEINQAIKERAPKL